MDHLSIDVELELPVASGAVSYALYGVIVHRGALRHREGEPAVRDCSARCAGMSAEVGHYYSYARPSDAVDAVGDGGAAGGWFRLDDSVSSPATFADIQADCAPGSLSTAYMMCYRRRYVAGGGGGAVDAGALAGEGGAHTCDSLAACRRCHRHTLPLATGRRVHRKRGAPARAGDDGGHAAAAAVCGPRVPRPRRLSGPGGTRPRGRGFRRRPRRVLGRAMAISASEGLAHARAAALSVSHPLLLQ